MSTVIWIAALLALALFGGSMLVRWGCRWGSTSAERALELPGDNFFEGAPWPRVVMTRAISIRRRPEDVWPWLAQLGRGAGWYSIDWLDNGRRESARHLVSWIPEPRLGDATAIGYLRHLDSGSSLAWWLGSATFLAAPVRSVTCYCVTREGDGTRLVSRISADARGPTGRFALLAFRAIDSLMASRQLLELRDRVEQGVAERVGSRDRETGDREQYQLYEVLYAAGTRAGVVGKESGVEQRRAAMKAGVLEEAEQIG